jgi:hypothetical protein
VIIIRSFIRWIVLCLERFIGRAGIQQGTVKVKVMYGKQLLGCILFLNGIEQQLGSTRSHQPVPVFAESRMIPDRITLTKTIKPAEYEIVVNPFT